MQRDLDDSSSPPKRRVSPWVKAFVFFHLLAITSWSLPKAPAGSDDLRLDNSSAPAKMRSVGRIISNGTLLVNDKYIKTSPTKFYLLFSGFWQYWDMFSPNPASTDFYGTAKITYKDGTVKDYQYPRMYSLGLAEKYVSERYRKFYERAHPEAYQWIWPTFAQRIALKNFKDPANPPVKVVLTRHWLKIEQPGEPPATEYRSYDYFTYDVDQNLLYHPPDGAPE